MKIGYFLSSEEWGPNDLPDVDQHVEAIKAYEAAGFDELYVNQIGPDQDAFFAAYHESVLPSLR